MANINNEARAKTMREYFTEKELNILGAALERLAEHHEDKANIQNETGINTKYKAVHKQAAYDVRELKINLNL